MLMAKLASAKKYDKPVDGHAPGLKGDDAKKYARLVLLLIMNASPKKKHLIKLMRNEDSDQGRKCCKEL
jgi:hypothetical protein